MTLILAIAYDDGIIMAADSASTDLESGTKQPAEKIRRIGNQPVLFGGSGDVGLLQKISDNLGAITLPNNIKRIRQEIKKAVVPELKESAFLHVPYPLQGFNVPPPAIILCAGVLNGTPWILEIEKDGRDTVYGPDLGGFAAIGSAKPFAQSLFRAHLGAKRSSQLAKIFAHRLVDDCVELAAYGLAKPVTIWEISKTGQVDRLSQAEVDALAQTCELWRSLERETVGSLTERLQAENGKSATTQPFPEIPIPPTEN